LREILVNVGEVIPIDRVGVRLSPTAEYNSTRDPKPHVTYTYVARMLQDLKVAFVEIADTNAWAGKSDRSRLLSIIRPNFLGPIILNGGLSPQTAEELVAAGEIELASFGRSYIANPDLAQRIASDTQLREPRSVGGMGARKRATQTTRLLDDSSSQGEGL
jgi:N-ethylmaleimide reductase